MQALLDLQPDSFFHIYTTVPAWLFDDSIPSRFQIHPFETDVGLVQNGPMDEDLPATLDRLERFLPIQPEIVQQLSRDLLQLGCRLVVCDIASLGILAARAAGLPCALIENFTWDWIYAAYLHDYPAFQPHIETFRETFSMAGYHLQCEPLCSRDEQAPVVPPVSRRVKTRREDVRQRLGIPAAAPVVLLSMGGVPMKDLNLDSLHLSGDVTLLVPGGSSRVEHQDNLLLLPWHGPITHPDLLNACDAVVGKTGYSTLAEVYHAGIPYGYLSRPRFRESPVLADFIQRRMHGIEIPLGSFHDGSWIELLPQLLDLPCISRQEPNGSLPAAAWLSSLLYPTCII